jgi:hypothetical protein
MVYPKTNFLAELQGEGLKQVKTFDIDEIESLPQACLHTQIALGVFLELSFLRETTPPKRRK